MINKAKFKIGNGRKISLWEDNWLGQGTLKGLFPNIHTLNQQQQATIEEVWTGQGWNLTFRRMLNDWEIDKIIQFHNTLEQFSGSNSNQDLIIWQWNRQGSFQLGKLTGNSTCPTIR